MDQPTIKKRETSFDAFRGVAIVAVVAIHTSNPAVAFSGWNYYFTIVLNQLCVFAVPFFFFMAGYFVNENNTGKKQYFSFLKTKLSRIMVPYLIWSLVAMCFFEKNYSFSNLCYNILLGRALGPYYFIIVLACLIVLTPFLFWIHRKPYGLFVVIVISLCSLITTYYLRIFSVGGLLWWKAHLLFTTWLIFYYVGLISRVDNRIWCFFHVMSAKKAIGLILLTLALSTFEAFYIVDFYGRFAGGRSAIKITSFSYSFAIISYFWVIKNKPIPWPRPLIFLGEYSFGIYLIHELFRGSISKFISANSLLLFSIQPMFQFVVVSVTIVLCIIVVKVSNMIIGKDKSYRYLGF